MEQMWQYGNEKTIFGDFKEYFHKPPEDCEFPSICLPLSS